MKLLPCLAALSSLLLGAVSGQVTPPDQAVADETETTISCELTEAPRASQVPVFGTQKQADDAKGSYHYKLWLPKGYHADTARRWPCMFIMSAGGNASMGPMAGWLKANGFVVVMLVEAKNGPWPPIVGNFLAAHDDVTKRVRIAEGKKYTTGQSGGARGSSVFVQLRPGFAGLILQAAGAAQNHGQYHTAGLARNAQLRIAMTMGNTDQNRGEATRMQALFSRQRLQVFEFNGGHQWAPPEVFTEAMAWVMGGTAAPAQSRAGSTNALPRTSPTASPRPSTFDEFFKKKN
jgi:hypothetical protein